MFTVTLRITLQSLVAEAHRIVSDPAYNHETEAPSLESHLDAAFEVSRLLALALEQGSVVDCYSPAEQKQWVLSHTSITTEQLQDIIWGYLFSEDHPTASP